MPTTRRRTLTTAAFALAATLPLGVVATGAAPEAAAAAPSCNSSAHVPSPNERLVVQWYVDFIGVFPQYACDDPGRFYWVDKLDRGVPREAVLAEIMPEAVKVKVWLITRGLYFEYLDHDAVDWSKVPPESVLVPGAAQWFHGLVNGMPVEWVQQNILAFPELSDQYQGDRAAYVGELYKHILRRYMEDDPGLRRYWVQRLNTVGNLAVVREIWYSTEGLDHRITEHYELFFDRKPSQGELEYWRPIEAASDINTQIRMAATPEYQRARVGKQQRLESGGR